MSLLQYVKAIMNKGNKADLLTKATAMGLLNALDREWAAQFVNISFQLALWKLGGNITKFSPRMIRIVATRGKSPFTKNKKALLKSTIERAPQFFLEGKTPLEAVIEIASDCEDGHEAYREYEYLSIHPLMALAMVVALIAMITIGALTHPFSIYIKP